MAKQLRDIETELDEERKPKPASVNAKKKLETEYKDLESTRDINNLLDGIEESTMLKGVMLGKDMTHSERQKRIIQTTQVTPMLPCCEEETREEGDLRKILEQELAKQRTQMEEMEDEMQQTEDQKR